MGHYPHPPIFQQVCVCGCTRVRVHARVCVCVYNVIARNLYVCVCVCAKRKQRKPHQRHAVTCTSYKVTCACHAKPETMRILWKGMPGTLAFLGPRLDQGPWSDLVLLEAPLRQHRALRYFGAKT